MRRGRDDRRAEAREPQPAAGGERRPGGSTLVEEQYGPVAEALRGEAGAPLPDAAAWSESLGADVSSARVVTGPAARAAARALDARAFTVGDRVFLGEEGAGAALLRHELTHVAQQRGAGAPRLGELGVTAPDEAVEREAKQGEAPTATGRAVIAREDRWADLGKSLDWKHYMDEFEGSIVGGVAAQVKAAPTACPSAYATLAGPLGARVELPSSLAAFAPLIAPDELRPLVDGGRTLDPGEVTGPARFYPGVPARIATAVVRRLNESLARQLPAYLDALAGQMMGQAPSPDQQRFAELGVYRGALVAAHPIDALTITALTRGGLVRFTGYERYRKDHPELKPGPRERTLRDVTCTPVGRQELGGWYRVSPADATRAEVARKLLGDETCAHQIEQAGTLFWFGHGMHLRLDFLDGALADEATLAQAGPRDPSKPPRSAQQTKDTLAQAVMALGEASTSATALGARATSGGGAIAAIAGRLASDEELARWDQLALEVRDVGSVAAQALGELARERAELLAQAGGKSELIAAPYREAALAIVRALDCLPLVEAARARLDGAFATRALVRVEVLDRIAGALLRQLELTTVRGKDATRNDDMTSADAAGSVKRAGALRERLGLLRAKVLAGDASALQDMKDLQAETCELQEEESLLDEIDQLDQALPVLEEAKPAGFYEGLKDKLGIDINKRGTRRYYIRMLQGEVGDRRAALKAARADWLAGRKPEARKTVAEVRKRRDLPALMSSVQSETETAAAWSMADKFFDFGAITLLTAGMGEFAGGFAAARGLGAAGTFLLTTGAEAFTAATIQTLLEKDPTIAGFLGDLAANFAMMAAIKGVAGVAKAAGLGTAGAAGVTFAASSLLPLIQAEVVKLAKEGKHLTQDEVRRIAIEAIIMQVGGMIAGHASRPLLSGLRGVGGTLGHALNAAEASRACVKAMADGLRGKRSPGAAFDLIQRHRAMIELQIKVLDELGRVKDPEQLSRAGLTEKSLAEVRARYADAAQAMERTQTSLLLKQLGDSSYVCTEADLPRLLESHRARAAEIGEPVTDAISGRKIYEIRYPKEGRSIKVFVESGGETTPLSPAAEAMARLKEPVTQADLGKLGALLGVKDIALAGNDDGVKVELARTGNFSFDVRVRVGRQATQGDVLAHASTVEYVQRYNGFFGRVRHVVDGVKAKITGDRGVSPFKPGTQGFASWVEVNVKLPEVARARQARFLAGEMGPEALAQEMEFIDAEYSAHVDVVEGALASGFHGEGESIDVAGKGEVTREAQAKGYPLPEKNPECYYYRRNESFKPGNGEPEFLLVLKWNAPEGTPSLRASVGPDGNVALATRTREAHMVKTDASPREIHDELRRQSPSYASFADALVAEKICDEAELLKALGEHKGEGGFTTVDDLRHAVKQRLRARILDTIALDKGLTDAESYQKMRALTDRLAPSDQGAIAEAWYQARHRPKAENHVHVKEGEGGVVKKRFIDLVDFVRDEHGNVVTDGGKAAIEIKSGAAEIDESQYDDYLKMAQNGVRGVKQLRYVFTNPKGAIENLKLMERALKAGNNVVVEFFTAGGERITVTDLAGLRAAEVRLRGTP